MQVTHYFDASLTSPVITTIPAMQGDGVRLIVARLMEGSNPWLVPEGVTAGLSYELPGKDPGYYDRLNDGSSACVIEGNQVSVVLDPILMEQEGFAKMSIILRDREGVQVATFPFHLWVKRVPGLIHGENLEAPAHMFEGKIYYGGPGGGLLPLGLGTGIQTEKQEDGSLLLVAEGGTGGIGEETDPTVPDWAKQVQKPRYTAQEVGAVSSDDLNTAIAEALAQAKSGGEFDGKDGNTPVRGVDYWTAADQEAIVQQVIAALGTPVFGRVDADKNIILTGELVAGTYTVKYEDGEGNVIEIGTLNHGGVPEVSYTNLADPSSPDWLTDQRLTSSGAVSASSGGYVTNFIPVKEGDIVRIRGLNIYYNSGTGTGNAVTWFYDNGKSAVAHIVPRTAPSAAFGTVNYEVPSTYFSYTVANRATFTTGDASGVAYMRLCGRLWDGFTVDDIVITVNQDITE